MTIKFKIIFGFIFLMMMTIIASTIGYYGFENSGSNLRNFQRYADADVICSDLIANLLGASHELVSFMKNGEEEAATQEVVYLKDANAKVEELAEKFYDPAIIEEVKIAKNEVEQFIALATEVTDLSRQVNESYLNIVRPSTRLIRQALINYSELALNDGNLASFKFSTETWSSVSIIMGALARYNSTYTDADKEIALAFNKDSDKFVDALKNVSRTEHGHALINEIEKANLALKNSILLMLEKGDALNSKHNELKSLQKTLLARTNKINNFAGTNSARLFAEAKTANSSGQTQLFTTSLVGIFIGLVLAMVIIIGLVRVLKDVSGFASALARGNFTYKVATKEKGEIGAMITGVQQIPTVLQALIDDALSGIRKIQVGYFKNRLDTKSYSGSYAELVGAVNAIADTYTSILDEMPVPLLTANKNNNLLYANKASASALDSKLIESYITEGESDFGITAIETGKSYTAESTFFKDNKQKTMAVTTAPLNDHHGNPAGFIEIITDLTEIKEQQRVMLQVAEEATAISTRVAAASEEIAAQVEQVSRGAEVQRARVESTASAMTEMNATVIEVARNAGEAAEQSDTTRSKAQDGERLVRQVMTSIDTVNSVSQNLHEKMQELGTQAENIGSVMNVISDIADQTNLLALNAAIEAARAGEAGRGFAVVADEVRKLAEKTMQATQEVGSSITSVQQSARSNMEEVAKAAESVEEANKLANSSGEALSEIVALASANSGIVTSIATAAEEQSATSDEISNAISEINTIVGETSEGMVQSSAAIQDLSSMAQELQRVMAGLR